MGRCLGTGQFLNRDIKKVALLDSVFLFILALDEKHSREGNGRLEENKTQGGKHMKKKIALLLAAAMTVSLMAGCGRGFRQCTDSGKQRSGQRCHRGRGGSQV